MNSNARCTAYYYCHGTKENAEYMRMFTGEEWGDDNIKFVESVSAAQLKFDCFINSSLICQMRMIAFKRHHQIGRKFAYSYK